jgi:hypothetical protein
MSFNVNTRLNNLQQQINNIANKGLTNPLEQVLDANSYMIRNVNIIDGGTNLVEIKTNNVQGIQLDNKTKVNDDLTVTGTLNCSSFNPPISGTGVQSVTAGTNIDITGTATAPIVNVTGVVQSVTAGTNVTITGTATNPIISASGGGGGSQNLAQVLENGNDAGGNTIVNLNGLTTYNNVSIINGDPVGDSDLSSLTLQNASATYLVSCGSVASDGIFRIQDNNNNAYVSVDAQNNVLTLGTPSSINTFENTVNATNYVSSYQFKSLPTGDIALVVLADKTDTKSYQQVYYSPSDTYAIQYYNGANPVKTIFEINGDKSVSIGDSTSTNPVVNVQGLVGSTLTQSRVFDGLFNNNIYTQYYRAIQSAGTQHNVNSSIYSFQFPVSTITNISFTFDFISFNISNAQVPNLFSYVWLDESLTTTYLTVNNAFSWNCGVYPTFVSTVPVILNYTNPNGISTLYLRLGFSATTPPPNKYLALTDMSFLITGYQSTIMNITPVLINDA